MRHISTLGRSVFALGVFALGLGASCGAMAQEAAAPASEPVLGTVNVVAARTPRTARETAGTVTVIEQQQIEEQLAQNIQDLVRYEPDLSVSRDATRFGSNGFTIRGIGGNRVLELVDGIPLSDTFTIGDFSDAGRNLVDPELVKRVEILRGSASALYGSDAIGGVVSFTTKDPQDYLNAGKPWQALGKAGYNSVDNSAAETVLGAFGSQANAGMLLFNRRDGQELDNRGDIGTRDQTRTQPNPQNYYDNNFLAKGVFNRQDATYRLIFSGTQGGSDTNVLSSIGSRDLSASIGAPPGFYVVNTKTQDGDDTQRALRLSGEAERGKDTPYTLLLSNDGTAPLEEVEMSGTVPPSWKVEFNPKTIPTLAPNQKMEVQAVVTPGDKTIAGDYVASFRANAKGGEQSSADFRITVTVSTIWGIASIAIIAVALLVLFGAVARFGRR